MLDIIDFQPESYRLKFKAKTEGTSPCTGPTIDQSRSFWFWFIMVDIRQLETVNQDQGPKKKFGAQENQSVESILTLRVNPEGPGESWARLKAPRPVVTAEEH